MKAPRHFSRPAMRKLQRPAIRALGCFHCKSTAREAQCVPCSCSLVVFSGTRQENQLHATCHSRCRRSVDDWAQHTRRIRVQLCRHDVNPVSSTLLACRDTVCTELRIEACMTCTCTTFGPHSIGRRSNVCAHGNWGVTVEVSRSLANLPWYVIRTS
jgi:hypothetical protein